MTTTETFPKYSVHDFGEIRVVHDEQEFAALDPEQPVFDDPTAAIIFTVRSLAFALSDISKEVHALSFSKS